MPDIRRHVFESFLEPFGLVLLLDADGSYVLDFANQDSFDPVGVPPITEM